MGAWDSGPFDNDDALDFVGDLADASELDIGGGLHVALSLPEGYVEAPEASCAVAAAALVATSRGYRIESQPALDLLRAKQLVPSDELREAARRALERVMGEESEWRELWDEAGLLDDQAAILATIRASL